MTVDFSRSLGLRDGVAADAGGGRRLAGNRFQAVGHDQRHFQVDPEPEQQGRAPDRGGKTVGDHRCGGDGGDGGRVVIAVRDVRIRSAKGAGQPARAAVVFQPGVVVALPEHQLLGVALLATRRAVLAVGLGGRGRGQGRRRRQGQLQRDAAEPQAARRLGHAGRQADGARPAVLAGRVAARVRLRARVPARVPAAVARAPPPAAGPAGRARQGGQAGRSATHPVVPGRARAAAQGLHQPGHVRARRAAAVAAHAAARPAGYRPVRKLSVPHERGRAAAVHAAPLRGRQRAVHHERGEHRSGESAIPPPLALVQFSR